MAKKKIFITGMAGYLGERLCRELDHTDFCGAIYGMDVKEPMAKYQKGEFRKMSVLDPELADWIKELKPDMVVHLAFVVDPVADEDFMYRVNIDGTQKLLDACVEAGVGQVLVASSATAYGAWPDNPVPLKETDPIRVHPTFSYARNKGEVESLLRDFEKKHPEIKLAIIRPCVIFGPNVNNYISELFTLPFALSPIGYKPLFQLVHEDDAARAVVFLLEKQATGPFNVAAPDIIDINEFNAMTKRPAMPMPDKLLTLLFRATWKLGLPLLKAPEPFLDYVRYPWVADPTKLMDLGFEFLYSTKETARIMLRSKSMKMND